MRRVVLLSLTPAPVPLTFLELLVHLGLLYELQFLSFTFLLYNLILIHLQNLYFRADLVLVVRKEIREKKARR